MKNKAVINEDSSGSISILKEEIKWLKLLLVKQKCTPGLCNRCQFEVEDKLSFSSHYSDIDDKIDQVGECSPIHDETEKIEKSSKSSDK